MGRVARQWIYDFKMVSMKVTHDNKLKKLIVVGDRVLIRPVKSLTKPKVTYLPPGVQEKEKIQRVM